MKSLLNMIALSITGNAYVYMHHDALSLIFIAWWLFLLLEGLFHLSPKEH